MNACSRPPRPPQRKDRAAAHQHYRRNRRAVAAWNTGIETLSSAPCGRTVTGGAERTAKDKGLRVSLRRRAIGGSWLDRLRSVARCGARRFYCQTAVGKESTGVLPCARFPVYHICNRLCAAISGLDRNSQNEREKTTGDCDPDAAAERYARPEADAVALSSGGCHRVVRGTPRLDGREERNDLIRRKRMSLRNQIVRVIAAGGKSRGGALLPVSPRA